MEEFIIRPVTPEDAEELLSIYAPYVQNTAISFEYDVPSVEEFRQRIESITRRYPYLAAQRGDELLGYCYLHPFVGRAAYDRAAETTIYVKGSAKRQGIGKALYTSIESCARAMGIINLEACIGVPIKEDPHLNMNSVEFHSHMGYRMVGVFSKCGYKFGTWYDMAWMEKLISRHVENPSPVKPFNSIPEPLWRLPKES